MAGCLLFPAKGFYFSMFFLFLKFLTTEGYMAPTITMMQNTVKPENQGSVVSAYLCFLTMAGCASTVLLSQLCQIFGAASNPAVYGKLVYAFSTIGLVGSVPAFYLAGKAHNRF